MNRIRRSLNAPTGQLLAHQQRQFLKQVRPAVLHGWAVLEEYPINYPFNEKYFNLSKAKTDQAVSLCLGNVDQFQGLAQVLAFCYRSGRCLEHQRKDFLLRAYAQAKPLSETEPLDHWAELFLYQLGNGFYKINQFEEAIAAYEAALSIKPDDHEALYNKGFALINLGRYEEAIATYDAALAIKPDFHEVFYSKACCYSLQGQVEPALENLERAIQLSPDEYREMAKTDTDFDAIREEPRFQALVEGDEE